MELAKAGSMVFIVWYNLTAAIVYFKSGYSKYHDADLQKQIHSSIWLKKTNDN